MGDWRYNVGYFAVREEQSVDGCQYFVCCLSSIAAATPRVLSWTYREAVGCATNEDRIRTARRQNSCTPLYGKLTVIASVRIILLRTHSLIYGTINIIVIVIII